MLYCFHPQGHPLAVLPVVGRALSEAREGGRLGPLGQQRNAPLVAVCTSILRSDNRASPAGVLTPPNLNVEAGDLNVRRRRREPPRARQDVRGQRATGQRRPDAPRQGRRKVPGQVIIDLSEFGPRVRPRAPRPADDRALVPARLRHANLWRTAPRPTAHARPSPAHLSQSRRRTQTSSTCQTWISTCPMQSRPSTTPRGSTCVARAQGWRGLATGRVHALCGLRQSGLDACAHRDVSFARTRVCAHKHGHEHTNFCGIHPCRS
jgi:hypothetical protein